MELRHLRYFVAAAEEMSISRAAVRLQVSQPPLSRQIRDLEQEIGTALFERSNNRLQLSSAGEFFLQEAKKILAEVERATRLTQAKGSARQSLIAIGFLSPLGGLFLPQIVRAFRQLHPAVDVDLLEIVPRKQVEALRERRIDIAFVPRVEIDPPEGLQFETVMHVELCAAVAPNHRLSNCTEIPLAELKEEPFVTFNRAAAPAMHEVLVRICRSAGFEPKIAKESDRAQCLLDLIATGAGVAILPEHFRRYPADVVMRPLAPNPLSIPLCMAWHPDDTAELSRELRAMILDHFQGGLSESAGLAADAYL